MRAYRASKSPDISTKHRVCPLPNRPKRVFLRNPWLQIHIGEQPAATLVTATHPFGPDPQIAQRITVFPSTQGIFGSPLSQHGT